MDTFLEATYYIFFGFISEDHNRTAKNICEVENSFGKGLCYTTIITAFIVESNLFEIFFLWKILMEVKKTTSNVACLLTRKAIVDRKR